VVLSTLGSTWFHEKPQLRKERTRRDRKKESGSKVGGGPEFIFHRTQNCFYGDSYGVTKGSKKRPAPQGETLLKWCFLNA